MNLYCYCNNDPVNYCDPSGHWIETALDLLSLGTSIVEVVINPIDPWAWAGLAGDALDLIPFVTGVGETIKGTRIAKKGVDVAAGMADGTLMTIRLAKASDFTKEAWETINDLDRIGDFTQSTMSSGRIIHRGYKTFDISGKEFSKFSGIRLDYFKDKTVFELKPFNRNSLHTGVKQLIRYRKQMGNNFIWVLEFY